MYIYFGDPTDLAAPPIYVEIQPTGWLLDGGVPLWACYGGAIFAAFAMAWRLATQRFSPGMADLATIVLPVLLTITGMALAGPIFNTQVGLAVLVSRGIAVRRGRRLRPGAPAPLRRVHAVAHDAAGRHEFERGHAMTRSARVFGGVGLGQAHLVLATLVGLWLTPVLLARVGAAAVRLVAGGPAAARVPLPAGSRRRRAPAA